jgi:hypothetical protein
MDSKKKECIEKKLMEYGVLTRRMKEKLIPELKKQCNDESVTEEDIDELAEGLFKMSCTPEDFETGKSMLELPEGETAQDIDSLLTVFAEKLNLNEDAGLTVAEESMDEVAEESMDEGVGPMDEDKGDNRKRRSDELDADELGAEESDPKKVKENEGLFGGSPEEYIDPYSDKHNPMHVGESIKPEEIKLEEKKKGRTHSLTVLTRPTYKGGSPEEGREATPYLYIILGLAIKDLPSMTYDTILRILQGAMKLSEMLSNKDNCIDDFLKSMIDKRILSFFKYYVIGEIALSSNPLTLMTSLMEITLKLLPYAKTALGMTIVSSLGYYIHHYINHYGGQVKDSIVGKLEELKTGLDELDSKTSGEIVEETNEKIKNSIESIKEVLKEKEIAEDGELTKVVGENMANEKEELKQHIGEFDDTMDMEQLKEKLKKKAEEEQPMEQAVPVAPAVAEADAEGAEDDDQEGGKKKKKGGATKKKKTNTKGKKKASKSKKSKTKKARKTRKTRKNKK